MKITVLVLVLCLMLISCASSPELEAYVYADELTFDAVAPEYLSWMEQQELSEDEVLRRTRLIDSWRARILNTKKSLQEGKNE